MNRSTPIQGCTFLLHPAGTERIFTPEDFTEEQLTFAQTAEDFVTREVLPHVDRLEKQEEGLMLSILKKAGDAGLFMIDIPEDLGGLGLDKATSMLCTEKISAYTAFSVSYGAHTGIGLLPLLFFGNAEQKERYVPRMATGELIGAYALTEPGSGSDAMGARTTATPAERDGRRGYVLNGNKMWITNAGFADLFTVFAKVEGKAFTAFLVEAGFEGVSTGGEEHKMGIKGSSTRMLILEDVFVPEENVLGEIGRGHKIAFNILNIGRLKLGVGTLGASKLVLEIAANYAMERKAFGQSISEFGAIRQKLSQMAVRLWGLESMCYRVAGYLDDLIGQLDESSDAYIPGMMAAMEEFAIEDSIMKVYGSETCDFIVDEAVQIHGGYGYSQEYAVERYYRDSRINRIFEGTNEINRLLIPGMLLKRGMGGTLPLFDLVQKTTEAAQAGRADLPAADSGDMAFDLFLAEQTKHIMVYTTNLAAMKYMTDLKDQQEVLMALADLVIAAYGIDSTTTRTWQLTMEGKASEVHRAMARLFTLDQYHKALQTAWAVLPSVCDADTLAGHIEALQAFEHRIPVDRIALERAVAEAVLDRPHWSF
jgi:alkylation response protein AidB-like acyl-CoA dehydrogenase